MSDETGREALRAAVLRRHEESQGPWPQEGHVCLECWQRWPCDAVRLATPSPAPEPSWPSLGDLRRMKPSEVNDFLASRGVGLRVRDDNPEPSVEAALLKLDAERDRAHAAGEHEYERGLEFIHNDLVAALRASVEPTPLDRDALTTAVRWVLGDTDVSHVYGEGQWREWGERIATEYAAILAAKASS